MGKTKGEKWIDKSIKRPGALHRALGVPQGQPIPAGKVKAAARRGGRVGAEAREAETLKAINRGRSGGGKR